MTYLVRWAILIVWVSYFGITQGLRGAFYGLLVFGLLTFCWYLIFDTWNRVIGAVRRPNVTVDARSVNIFPQDERAMRGVPTTDDFAGMIEYRKGGRL